MAGRMLGGVGWIREIVQAFLGRDVYTIPCGRVPKGDDPDGRIVHNYSYAAYSGWSINSALLENSVQYIASIDRVKVLSRVSWYVTVDLKAGYRQMPLNPSE